TSDFFSGTFHSAEGGTFLSDTSGTFLSAEGGTFLSDTSGTFIPILSVQSLSSTTNNYQEPMALVLYVLLMEWWSA
ncbi:MAG: hypothetical protein IKX65_04700, partial [Prevotella sp.]|nr:hypothetical protein [Prevotella sp.]